MECCLLSHPNIHFCFISLHRLFHKQHLAVALFTEMLLRQICHFSPRAQYSIWAIVPLSVLRWPQLMFWQHNLSHMRLTIFKFKSGSFLLYPHLYTSSKKGHSEKMLALILMICHQSYWHTLQSRHSIHQPLEKASHKQRQCCTCEFTSAPSRWCQCKQSCWGPFTRFYVNLHLLNSMSQSGCPFVARRRSSQFLLRMPELSRANISNWLRVTWLKLIQHSHGKRKLRDKANQFY